MRSALLRSHSLPRLATLLKRIPFFAASRPRILAREPLCETRPTGPGSEESSGKNESPDFGQVQPHAIRSQDAHSGRAGNTCQLILEGFAFIRSGLLISCGEEHSAFNPFRGTVLYHFQSAGMRNQYDCQVHRVGYFGHPGIGFQPVNFAGIRVNRINLPGESRVQKRHEEQLAHLFPAGQTDDGYGFGTKKGIKLSSQFMHVFQVSNRPTVILLTHQLILSFGISPEILAGTPCG